MSGARRVLAVVTPLAVGLLACSGGDDGPLGPVALEGIGDDDGGDADPDADAIADVEDGSDGADRDVAPQPTALPGVIDLAVAGTVRVDLVDGRLQLGSVEPAERWRERSRQVDDEEVEVTLVRDDGGELDLEVEVDGDAVRVTWQLEVAPIGEGAIPLGEAGELVVSLRGDELVLEELRLAPGWEVVDEDVDDDEIDLELRRGEATLGVEVELDDGALELILDLDSGRMSAARG